MTVRGEDDPLPPDSSTISDLRSADRFWRRDGKRVSVPPPPPPNQQGLSPARVAFRAELNLLTPPGEQQITAATEVHASDI
jgi:hypothetical protein